jgi:hypothetical protein
VQACCAWCFVADVIPAELQAVIEFLNERYGKKVRPRHAWGRKARL